MIKKTTVGAVAKNYSTGASLAPQHREKSLPTAPNSSELIDQFLKLLGKPHDAAWVRYIDPLKKQPSGPDHQWFGSQQDLERLQERQSKGFNAYLIIGNGTTATGKSGNQNDADITDIPALFVEWDDAPIDWQIGAWQEFGLPEPSIQVHTGGKSIHSYWLLNEPMAPEAWCELIKRLIEHCGADPANKNPSRVMRLPGSIYYDKKTGEATNRCEIVSTCDRRYSVSEIEACVPPVLPTPTPRAAASTRFAAPSSQWEPRSIDEIRAAAEYIPNRIGGDGTYEQDRNALCGCAAALAEAGYSESIAIDLLGPKWPTAKEAEQVLGSATTRSAGSYWRIAKEHGYQLNRPRGCSNG
jgi:hypothetical protein